ncbi:MAG: hypothetical protein HQ485_08225 [Acidobacteria bacterium]|jgi:hypothetical protein|nr:hypothetical protein [Acidobacteriota bacterium]
MTQTPPAASTRRILAATGLALAVALAVLVTAVLPAEYGIDPLGTGNALGLTALAGTSEGDSLSVDIDPTLAGATPDQVGPLVQDTFTVELRPYEGVEYKYRLEQGSSLVYAWTASSKVAFDFHGEPDGAPPRYSESYGKGDAASAQGVFVAPTPGIHGWFWENPGAGRVTITLTTSGFYTASTEYRDGERHERSFGPAR